MRALPILSALLALAVPASLSAQTIYPIDRADILVGAHFDLKVEFATKIDATKAQVTINGMDHAKFFGKAASFVEREDDKDQSALVLRDVSVPRPGTYTVKATDGTNTAQVTWTVFGTGPRVARNVIIFIGDGMTIAHRTAARMLSKGISQGKYKGQLAMDDMPAMALVSTAGTESIITDSANSAHAYTTGHKSANNALGVYADRTKDVFDDPKVETLASLAKRRANMAVGVVTNTEIEDATPASMVAHTRRRSEYDRIVEQFYVLKPDVIMGGGSANFLPKSTPGSKRKDDVDYIAKFRDGGYIVVSTATELKAAAAKQQTTKLLGLFNLGNMDGVLDRRFLKGGTVSKFPDQPDLTDQFKAAVDVLSRNPNGFVLMVESGLIDKYAHVLDMERSVYDVIMLDNVVRLAKEWAAKRNDTLILVVADHGHPLSLVGTINDDMQGGAPNVEMRERVGVYESAGFPNYPTPDADGYPAKIDVSRRLALFSAGFPDYYETFRPKMDTPNVPTVAGQNGTYEANPKYKDAPGAVLRPGNLPRNQPNEVHSGDDVILTAIGPGSHLVRGHMANTEVFRVMVNALGLGR